MSERITIEPNDQSWEGKKIVHPPHYNGECFHIKYVGNSYIIVVTNDGTEFCELRDRDDWELYEEPEKEYERSMRLRSRIYDNQIIESEFDRVYKILNELRGMIEENKRPY